MQAGKKTAFLPVTRPTHMMNKQFCKAFFFYLSKILHVGKLHLWKMQMLTSIIKIKNACIIHIKRNESKIYSRRLSLRLIIIAKCKLFGCLKWKIVYVTYLCKDSSFAIYFFHTLEEFSKGKKKSIAKLFIIWVGLVTGKKAVFFPACIARI